MNPIRKLSVLFVPPRPAPRATEARARALDREVVKAHASGNIRLQNGWYATKRDLDEEYEKIRRHKFV